MCLSFSLSIFPQKVESRFLYHAVHSSSRCEHVSEVCGGAAGYAARAAVDCPNVKNHVVRGQEPTSSRLSSVIFTAIAFFHHSIVREKHTLQQFIISIMYMRAHSLSKESGINCHSPNILLLALSIHAICWTRLMVTTILVLTFLQNHHFAIISSQENFPGTLPDAAMFTGTPPFCSLFLLMPLSIRSFLGFLLVCCNSIFGS